ncbi:MAG: FAD-dependent oxidoreductase, partial [Actinobacteria bacterium]|nr:FAD-dependent oxidoreductase [Actinomycetota bacterium]
ILYKDTPMILTFIEKIERTSDCFSFFFQPPKKLEWIAGQYMQFTLAHDEPDDRGVSRFFTISSAPHEEIIMITTRFAGHTSSTFKKALMSLERGQNISAFEPQGEFVLNDKDKNYIFVAGGIGITPFRSILADLEYKKMSGKVQIQLLYSNRDNEIVFKDEIDNLAVSYNSFKVRYIIYPEICDIGLIRVAVPFYREKTYYISGPPGLVKSVEEQLLADGIRQEEIMLDYFPGY